MAVGDPLHPCLGLSIIFKPDRAAGRGRMRDRAEDTRELMGVMLLFSMTREESLRPRDLSPSVSLPEIVELVDALARGAAVFC